MNRRFLMHSALYLGASLAFSTLDGLPAVAQAVDVNAILNDPEAPTSGNPAGDVTIVAFTDYNCPFCKKSSPDLERLVKTDGKIRLVYKDLADPFASLGLCRPNGFSRQISGRI